MYVLLFLLIDVRLALNGKKIGAISPSFSMGSEQKKEVFGSLPALCPRYKVESQGSRVRQTPVKWRCCQSNNTRGTISSLLDGTNLMCLAVGRIMSTEQFAGVRVIELHTDARRCVAMSRGIDQVDALQSLMENAQA